MHDGLLRKRSVDKLYSSVTPKSMRVEGNEGFWEDLGNGIKVFVGGILLVLAGLIKELDKQGPVIRDISKEIRLFETEDRNYEVKFDTFHEIDLDLPNYQQEDGIRDYFKYSVSFIQMFDDLINAINDAGKRGDLHRKLVWAGYDKTFGNTYHSEKKKVGSIMISLEPDNSVNNVVVKRFRADVSGHSPLNRSDGIVEFRFDDYERKGIAKSIRTILESHDNTKQDLILLRREVEQVQRKGPVEEHESKYLIALAAMEKVMQLKVRHQVTEVENIHKFLSILARNVKKG